MNWFLCSFGRPKHLCAFTRKRMRRGQHVEVYCPTPRLGRGFGDVAEVCEKHARYIRAEDLRQAQRAHAAAGVALREAEIALRAAAQRKQALAAKLARRNKS